MVESTFWLTFWATTSGAAAGAGLSGIVAWKIYMRQEQNNSQNLELAIVEKYQERLSDEIVKAAGAMQKFLIEIPLELDDIGREKMIISSYLDIAAMKAKDSDLELLQLMAGVALDINQNTPEKHQLLVWDIITSLYGWRTKVNDINFYLAKFRAPYQPPDEALLHRTS